MEQRPTEETEDFYQASFDLFAGGEITQSAEVIHLNCSEPSPHPTSREFELLVEAEGYSVFCFAKDNPEKNCFRRYIISYQPSLWDKYTVSRQWGRVGSDKQFYRDEHFRSSRPALARVQNLIKRRVKRGYHLTNAS